MRIIALVITLVCFMGCTTTQWNQLVWGNPKGAWWKNPPEPQKTSTQHGALCAVCLRGFVVPNEVLKNSKEVVCPYCGAKQDAQMAINRYTYESQVQQQKTQQQQMQAFQDRQKEINDEYQRKIEDINRRRNEMQTQRRGSILDPVYIKTVP